MKKITRKMQSELTKNSIVEAITQLMHNKDITAITIRDICTRAKVSVGTFYVYFSCKEEAVLYIYRSKDEVFNHLNLNGTPMENIEKLMVAYFDMVERNNLSYNRHLYICHLTYYDEYFFSEERAIFQLLNKQIGKMTLIDSKKITWELLEYARGNVYNLCISFSETDEEWYEDVLTKTFKYLNFLLNRFVSNE